MSEITMTQADGDKVRLPELDEEYKKEYENLGYSDASMASYINAQLKCRERQLTESLAREEAKDRRLGEAQEKLARETSIVDRIWDIFGRPSYEELKGRSIYDLILELKAQLTTRESTEDAWKRGQLEMQARSQKEWEDIVEQGVSYEPNDLPITPYIAPEKAIMTPEALSYSIGLENRAKRLLTSYGTSADVILAPQPATEVKL